MSTPPFQKAKQCSAEISTDQHADTVSSPSPHHGDIQVELVTSLEELHARREIWQSIYDQSDASPYDDFDWVTTQLEHGEVGDGLFVFFLRDAIGPFAVLPMKIHRGLFARQLKLVNVRSFTTRNTGIIARRAKRCDVARYARDHLRTIGCGWDYWVLESLPEASALLEGWESTRSTARFPGAVRRKIGSAIVINLPKTWDEFRSAMRKSLRQTIARKTRALEKKGELTMRRPGFGDPGSKAELQRVIEDALRVNRAGWQGSKEKGRSISDDDTIELFRNVSMKLGLRGQLDLSVLYVGDHPVSFYWGPARHPMTSLSKTAYDAHWREGGPGVVHMGMLVKDSIERGWTTIDMGHQFAQHKQRWSETAEELFYVWYYRRPIISRIRRTLQERLNRLLHGRASS